MKDDNNIRIVDLFAGIGGLKQGVTQALLQQGKKPLIAFTSEIKKPAISIMEANWANLPIAGDIRNIDTKDIPEHDLLLAGFPCQAFSYAGKRLGFSDETKGTLFFEVLRILKHHKPDCFILENVEGLVQHDPDPKTPEHTIGRTLTIILDRLTQLGYTVDWRLLNATDFGVPQARKRLFIVGSHNPTKVRLNTLKTSPSAPLYSILENNIPETDPKVLDFEQLLKRAYPDLNTLEGSIFRDWRGGTRNIHSWNINFKGETTPEERAFLELLMTESKRNHWGKEGLKRVGEGFPLTVQQIQRFHNIPEENLNSILAKLTTQHYLKQEGNTFRISSGKLTMPISHILSKDSYTNTLVATDANRLAIIDHNRLRRFTQTEVKRLFGFADDFVIPNSVSPAQFFDVFGNSVVIPVAQAVATTLYE